MEGLSITREVADTVVSIIFFGESEGAREIEITNVSRSASCLSCSCDAETTTLQSDLGMEDLHVH